MFRFLLPLLAAAPSLRAGVPLTYFQDWFPGAPYAGLYVAVDRGFFREAGLDLTVHPFAFGQNVVALMDADLSRPAIGTLEGYILLEKRAQGSDLRVYTAVLRESPAGYLALPGRPLASARDFIGRRVGVHKYGDPLYRFFLRRAAVDPTQATMVFVDDDVGRLQRGEVDLMQGYAIEELVRLRDRVGAGAGFLSFRALGFDAYSQVVFATAAQERRLGPAAGRFITALRRGWTYALAHPDAAVAAVASRLPASRDLALVREMFLATAPFVAPAGTAPLGAMSAGKWAAMSAACVEMGLLSRPEDPAAFLVAAP